MEFWKELLKGSQTQKSSWKNSLCYLWASACQLCHTWELVLKELSPLQQWVDSPNTTNSNSKTSSNRITNNHLNSSTKSSRGYRLLANSRIKDMVVLTNNIRDLHHQSSTLISNNNNNSSTRPERSSKSIRKLMQPISPSHLWRRLALKRPRWRLSTPATTIPRRNCRSVMKLMTCTSQRRNPRLTLISPGVPTRRSWRIKVEAASTSRHGTTQMKRAI